MTNVLESLTNDPSVKQAVLAGIEARRASLQEQLAELDEAEKSLSGDEGAKRRGRPKGSGKGRPRGKRTGPSQRQQILTLLADNKEGLRAGDLGEKTGIDSKVLQTTLSVMRSKHKEIKVSGKSKRDGGLGFVYAITKAGVASQKAAEEKAAEKAAAAE